MQSFTVASGIIIDDGRVCFVQNRRRNGSLDWSPPGGVVDPGEGVLEALQREVIEETALTVQSWSPLIYQVQVDFVERDLHLLAEVYLADDFSGSLHVDDPDNVVVAGRWVQHAEADRLLGESPRWVAEPLRHALGSIMGPDDGPGSSVAWKYAVTGTGRRFEARRLAGPNG